MGGATGSGFALAETGQAERWQKRGVDHGWTPNPKAVGHVM